MEWIEFFKAAGLPHNVASGYADIFSRNRIKESYLVDINKEYLHDMGITMIGDVIAILKHIKLHMEKKADPLTDSATSSPDSHRESPTLDFKSGLLPKETLIEKAGSPTAVANRTLKHFVSKSNSCKPEVPVPTRRRVTPEIEGKYKISLPKGTTAKTRMILKLLDERKARNQAISMGKALHSTQQVLDDRKSVFRRLGDFGCSAEPDTTTAGIFARNEEESAPASVRSPAGLTSSKSDSALNLKVSSPLTSSSSTTNLSTVIDKSSSVFERLGQVRKRKVTFDIEEESDASSDNESNHGPPLAYQGVLKMETAAPKRTRPVYLPTPPKPKVPKTTSAGIFASGGNDTAPAKSRLGSLPQQNVAKTVSSSSNQGSSIKKRLGSVQSSSENDSLQPPVNSSSRGVLKRLGTRL